MAQDPDGVTRAPKITHNTARLRWADQSAQDIDRLSRGISHQVARSPLQQPVGIPLTPQYPLWTTLNAASIQLFRPTLYESNESAAPGTARLLRKQGKLAIACSGDSWVQVERVKSQGKKEVPVNDWWNGLPKGVREGKEVVFE